MTNQILQRWALAGLSTFVAAGAWAQTPKVVLKYASDVLPGQSSRLNEDLIYLDSIKFNDVDGEAKRLFKVPEFNAENLQPWLQERARVVVGENFQLDESSILVMNTGVTYPKPNEFPELGSIRQSVNQEVEQPSGPMVIMSNMGGVLYLFGKQNQVQMGLKVDGVGDVEIKSPRAGIFKIGEGLFVPIASVKGFKDPAARLYSFFRLGTLFHESRHSDGSGKTALFAHAVCPSGHDYQGMPACDTPANGPYRIEALMMKSISQGMTDLNPAEKEVLALFQLDAESRVLSPLKAGEAPKTPAPDADLCSFLNNLNLRPDFCRAQSPTEVVEWDDTPESL